MKPPVRYNPDQQPRLGLFAALAVLLFHLSGSSLSPAAQPAALIEPVADGTPARPAAPTAFPDWRPVSTLTTTILREEPPPLAGMTAIRKQVSLTMRVIPEPVIAMPAPPLPPLPPTDPAVIARMAELRARYRSTEIVFVSATVYDHRTTFVRWWPNGRLDREMHAWSNIDFNVLSGFGSYRYQDRKFYLFMGLGNEDTARLRRLTALGRSPQNTPAIPVIPADGPGYIIESGDTTEPSSLDIIKGLHELYQNERPRLEAAYAGREAARIAHEAQMRRNPPQPQAVTTWISQPRRIDPPAK